MLQGPVYFCYSRVGSAAATAPRQWGAQRGAKRLWAHGRDPSPFPNMINPQGAAVCWQRVIYKGCYPEGPKGLCAPLKGGGNSTIVRSRLSFEHARLGGGGLRLRLPKESKSKPKFAAQCPKEKFPRGLVSGKGLSLAKKGRSGEGKSKKISRGG